MPDQIQRVPCDMSAGEFENKFVRVGVPAMITGCNFSWPTKYGEMSVENVYEVSCSQFLRVHTNPDLNELY